MTTAAMIAVAAGRADARSEAEAVEAAPSEAAVAGDAVRAVPAVDPVARIGARVGLEVVDLAVPAPALPGQWLKRVLPVAHPI